MLNNLFTVIVYVFMLCYVQEQEYATVIVDLCIPRTHPAVHFYIEFYAKTRPELHELRIMRGLQERINPIK